MNFAFLCHAPVDAAAAAEIARWLERNSSCAIRLEECGEGSAHDLVEAAEQALAADAVILLLSPDSVPRPWPPRSRWEPVLLEQPAEAGVGLAWMVLRECRFPELLRRRNCFDSGLSGLRGLRRWLLARSPRVEALPAGPASAPDDAIEELRRRVGDDPGGAADVPWETALAFARRCADEFEGVFWIDGARRTEAGICGDLAEAAGLRLPGPAAQNAERLRVFCAGRRTLLVFDRCASAPFAREGKCSMVLTAARPEPLPAAFDEMARMFASWSRRPEECLAALRDVPAAIAARDWPDARSVVYGALSLLRLRERAAEVLELVDLAMPLAAAAGDEAAVRHFDWERSWILQAWGGEVAAAGAVAPGPGDQIPLPFAPA